MLALPDVRVVGYGRRINAHRPHAERAVCDETTAIILDLEPIARSLIRDLAVAFARDNRLVQLLTAGRGTMGSPDTMAALDQLERSVVTSGALRIELGDGQAEALAEELDEARVEPESCAVGVCDLLAMPGYHYCAAHEGLR